MEAIRLLPLHLVQSRTSDCKAKTYELISEGRFPPPVKLDRKSVWPAHEVDAIVTARIGGATDDGLRALVKRLVEQRKARYASLMEVA